VIKGGRKLARYLQLAGISSTVFLLVILCAPLVDEEWMVVVGFLVGMLLLGALVLVPQLPAWQRHPFRSIALICLPLLSLVAAEFLLAGSLQLLDLLSDRDYSARYDTWVMVVAQLIWIPAVANIAVWMCHMRTRNRFQNYLFTLAAFCAGFVAIFFYILEKCLLRSCPDWMTVTMVASMAVAYSVLPPGLAMAFHFGTEDGVHDPDHRQWCCKILLWCRTSGW